MKNVTAADVASSLYYSHLNSEDDARFREEDQPEIVEESRGSMQKALPRKPLPDSARSSLDLNRQMSSASLTSDSIPRVPRRKLTSEIAVPVSQPQPVQGKQNISRRPLGPRPLLLEPTSRKDPLPGPENRSLTSTSEFHSGNTRSSLLKEVAPSQPGVSHKSSDAFSITLIRRDPSSGAQWNIGNVSGHPCSEDPNRRPKINPQVKKPYFNISVELSNPGYSAFRNPVPTGRAEDSGSDVVMRPADGIDIDQKQNPSTPSSGFDRQLRMEGSSFWSRPSIQHKRARSDLSGKLSTMRERSLSGSSNVVTAGSSKTSQDFGLGFSDSQSKGYVFTSPWGGRCKFTTASGGRSLHCRHTLPAPVSASNTTEPTSLPQISAAVSELRFNLPSSAVFSSSTSVATSKGSDFDSGRFTTSKLGNLRKKLSPHKSQPPLPLRPHPTSYAALYPSDEEETPPLPPRSYCATDSTEEAAAPPLTTNPYPFPQAMNLSQEEYVDEDPRLDLSIGQEKAGGGNRGKRAKLGKLIIHDEGFKMLDLVVAANIGVWWSVWESVSH